MGGRGSGGTRDCFKKITLLPDGTKHSAGELAAMFGVRQPTISRQYVNGKTSWTRAELEEWAKKLEAGFGFRGSLKAPATEKYEGPPRNINDVEYRPSAIERALLAL